MSLDVGIFREGDEVHFRVLPDCRSELFLDITYAAAVVSGVQAPIGGLRGCTRGVVYLGVLASGNAS